MKIYTKTGDKGQTSLFGGGRVDKDSQRIHVIGTVDELNSLMGIAASQLNAQNSSDIGLALVKKGEIINLTNKLLREQSNLLRLGADFATPVGARERFEKTIRRMTDEDVSTLEKEIDEWTDKLPQLTKFILPGGSMTSAFIHHARSVCRRAERAAFNLSSSEDINEEALRFLNRLSDWLFTLARYVNKLQGVEDTFQVKKA